MAVNLGPFTITLAGQNQPAPTQQGKLSAEEIAKMSWAERLDYCRRFPQHLESGARKT